MVANLERCNRVAEVQPRYQIEAVSGFVLGFGGSGPRMQAKRKPTASWPWSHRFDYAWITKVAIVLMSKATRSK